MPQHHVLFLLTLCAGSLAACGQSGHEATHDHADSAHATSDVAAAEATAHEHDDNHEDEAHDHHDEHDADRRDVGAHLHGDAKLSIAVEEAVLYIELDTPLFNLLGFEHAPSTDEQIQTERAAEARLQQPETLFAFNDQAGCTPLPGAPVALRDGAAEPAHEDDEEHGDKDGDEHGDDHAHDHDGDEEDGHSDALIEYRFNCQAPAQLATIDVLLFKHFGLLEELDVVYLDQTRQTSYTLSPTNARIELER